MAACGGLQQGSTYDCDNPIQPGVNPRLLLGDLDDIESITYDVSNSSLITAITMKSTTQMWAFEGYRQSLNPSFEFVPQTLSIGYDHNIEFQCFDISSSQKLNLEKMALAKLFAIVENRNAAGNSDSVFEVFGTGAGLEVQTLTRLNRDLETAGSFSIGLKTSDDEGKETKMPLSFWDTDYATTLAKVEALLTPAT